MGRLIVNAGLILAISFLAVILTVLVIKALNWLVQWAGEQLGYEVGDFFGWMKSKLPKRKAKKDRATTRLTEDYDTVYLIFNDSNAFVQSTQNKKIALEILKKNPSWTIKEV